MNKAFAQFGQIQFFFQADLPKPGKVKINSKGGCPSWAKAN